MTETTPAARWIDRPADLDAATERALALGAPIALDTEFVRERTYWPQLALVQLALAAPDGGCGEILLIEPLAAGMAQALARLLDAPLVKLMHSAGEDLIALRQACGRVPQPLFDTQVAAALSGVGAGLGYQRLVLELLGEAVDKGETRSDWLRRPLSDSQLRYAADDVRHLHAMHAALSARLDTLDRHAWLAEDCARLTDAAVADAPERWPHLGVRPAALLDRAGQLRLLRLLRWREHYARSHDRPRTWILDNDLALMLARSLPANAAELQRSLERHPKAPRKLGDTLWQALNTALPDEDQAPPVREDEPDKQRLKRLQQAVAERSAALGLPDGVLASRRWLEALLETPADADWPGPLAGWRRAELLPSLGPLLTGPVPAVPPPAG